MILVTAFTKHARPHYDLLICCFSWFDDLTTAQLNKYQRLADLADIQPGDKVLEIGCGWADLQHMYLNKLVRM